MKEVKPYRKEIYDPITGLWLPSDITDDDVVELMIKADELMAEEAIMSKIFLKSIGATDGWAQPED
jgi:hypothetical protein